MTIPHGQFITSPSQHRLHYHDIGQGPAVVFIHGSGPGASGWSNFKLNAQNFVDQGFRVILPDLIGYGLSDKPITKPYTLDFFTDHIRYIIEHIGLITVTLVGNSLGGAIALRLAMTHPQLVDKLILMAPGGIETRERYFAMPGIAKMSALFAQGALDFTGMKALLSLQVYDPSQVSDQTIEERVAVCQTQPKEVLSTMSVPNLTPSLSTIFQPILGFWGINDQFTPHTGAQTILEHCPQARVVMLNRCGHWVMVEHREVFNRYCIDFLRNN